jgi:hypothetical protein
MRSLLILWFSFLFLAPSKKIEDFYSQGHQKEKEKRIKSE